LTAAQLRGARYGNVNAACRSALRDGLPIAALVAGRINDCLTRAPRVIFSRWRRVGYRTKGASSDFGEPTRKRPKDVNIQLFMQKAADCPHLPEHRISSIRLLASVTSGRQRFSAFPVWLGHRAKDALGILIKETWGLT
jgi:hypothetical protein